MKSVFLDYATLGANDLDLSPLRSVLPGLKVFDNTLPEQRETRIQDVQVVLCNKVRLDAGVLRRARALKFIGLTATGTDNVDLDYARTHGIAVCNLLAYCTRSVVEHVFGVLLNLAHNIRSYDRLVRDGGWARAESFCALDYPIRQLSAMTLGIIGYGELGKGVERFARQFGMHIMIARRRGKAGHAGDGRHDFEEVLASVDVLTLHCPLTEDTQHLINADTLSLMRPGSILINTARGGLVDSAALATALANGTPGAAAIDVLSQEPPVKGDPLLDYRGKNLIITPHVAWATHTARQTAIDELAANYKAFTEGQLRNRVI